MSDVLPYGRWPSAVSAEMLVGADLRFAEVCADGDTLWWSENRPSEGGRTQLVRHEAGRTTDVLPDGFGARTLVHEYGGGAWTVRGGTVVFSNLADQRLYRLDADAAAPVPISPGPEVPRGWRYADLRVVSGSGWGGGAWVLAVRESHEPEVVERHGEAMNEVVALPLDGSAVDDPARVPVLVTGPDFVASPRASYDGRLAWVQWDHPNMPWDNTSLWVAHVLADSGLPRLGAPVRVAGGSDEEPESVMCPVWSPTGELWFSSDRSSWWNLHRWDGETAHPVAPVAAEAGNPGWGLGKRDYDLLPDGRMVTVLNSNGQGGLAVVDPAHPHDPPRRVECGVTAVQQVVGLQDGRVLAVAGGPTLPFTTVVVSLQGAVQPLRPSGLEGVDERWWSVGEPFDYPSADGRTAHAVLYRPRNPDAVAPEGALPPLVVILHGGPTSRTDTALRPAVQYWTSRGFAVADLDYTGSTGYGREYRRALYGRWGVVDVEDCLAVVHHLAAERRVDPRRAVIRGGSAGGFTTLAALTSPGNSFAAGASYFGVADLMALAQDTHKFESRYLDQLVGPLPETEHRYRERSPITHIDRLAVPLVIFQGDADPVVPPEQSRMIARALEAKGLDVEYVEFAGEQHGFREAATIVEAAETELAFYQRVLGL